MVDYRIKGIPFVISLINAFSIDSLTHVLNAFDISICMISVVIDAGGAFKYTFGNAYGTYSTTGCACLRLPHPPELPCLLGFPTTRQQPFRANS